MHYDRTKANWLSHRDLHKRGGETWITEAKTTVFHNFWKQKLLNSKESPEDFREASEKEKAELEKIRDEWVRPPQNFIDLWNAIPGTTNFNEETGYFEASIVKDLTYQDAMKCYLHTYCLSQPRIYYGQSAGAVRVILPIFPPYTSNPMSNMSGLFKSLSVGSAKYEVIMPWVGSSLSSNHMESAFMNCIYLRRIEGTLSINADSKINDETFKGCSALEYVNLGWIKKDTSFADCPNLSLEFFNLIAKKANDATLTLHPELYAKIIEGEGEWEGMVEKLTASGLTLASA